MVHIVRRSHEESLSSDDECLFGWNQTPGIISVWADRSGKAMLWQREGERVTCSTERFCPWLVATTLDDLAHLPSLVQFEEQDDGEMLGSGSALSSMETTPLAERRDYDVEQYARVLLYSYASRLAVVFTVEDFQQLFRLDGQMSLFDRPLEAMQLRWIRCPSSASERMRRRA